MAKSPVVKIQWPKVHGQKCYFLEWLLGITVHEMYYKIDLKTHAHGIFDRKKSSMDKSSMNKSQVNKSPVNKSPVKKGKIDKSTLDKNLVDHTSMGKSPPATKSNTYHPIKIQWRMVQLYGRIESVNYSRLIFIHISAKLQFIVDFELSCWPFP